MNRSTGNTHADSIRDEHVQLFRSLFVAREDAHAVWRGGQPVAVRKPLTDEVLAAHLAGECRVGTYLIRPDGKTPFLVLDLDVKKRSLARRIVKRLRKKKVTACVERSKSKGFHIWVFFDKPLRAARARQFAYLVLHGLDVSKIEVFPKQDQIREGGLGNCIWLPLFGRDKSEGRTVFLDEEFAPHDDQWSLLKSIHRTSKKLIVRAVRGAESNAMEPREPLKSTVGPEYDYIDGIQRKLLSLYIRKPERCRDYIQPSYFNSPIHLDIVRWVSETYEKHPDTRLDKYSLRALVHDRLVEKRRREAWPLFKREIKAIFALPTSDDDFVADRALGFARERAYRKYLVKAESCINSGDYDAARREFDKLQAKFRPQEVEKNGGPKLPVYNVHQFLAQKDEANSDDLVQDIVPRQGATLFYGLPKELKSWGGLQLAVDVADGHTKALDYFPIPCAAKVLYTQIEDRDKLTRERLAALMQDGSLRRPSTFTNLHVIPRCGLHLSDKVWVDLLKKEVEKFRPKLIVFDVFRRLFHGNASDSKEVAEFLRVLDDFRDTHGCAIILVHHAKKSESSEMQAMALGSVNLTGWAEALLYTHDKKKVGGATVAKLDIVTKSFTGELEIVVDSDSDPMVRVREKSADGLELVVKTVRENPGIDQKELQEKIGVPIKKLRDIVKKAIKLQRITEGKADGKGNHHAYYAAES